MKVKIKKVFQRGVAIALVFAATLGCIPMNAKAESKTVYKQDGSYYNVYTMRTYYAEPKEKKIDALGFNKTKYTYGSITVTKSQSFGFSTSTSVDAKYKGVFCDVGASFGVTSSVTESVSAGVTIGVDKSAPNGVYYAYMCVPHKKVYFSVKRCSSNYVSWDTKYEKTFKFAPVKNMEYIDVKAVTIY